MLGVGYGSGPDRAEEAAYNAINTPLINNNVIEVGAWEGPGLEANKEGGTEQRRSEATMQRDGRTGV